MAKSFHWADQAAENIIKIKDKNKYTLAAGITPSGTIHIGNFREIITVDLVAKALEKKEKKIRFIYSWDDYDVFRKVPPNIPKQNILKKYLRQPIVDIPDTYECNHKSYAHHNEAEIEEDLPKLNINPEFLYQANKYRNCEYADLIKTALQNKDKIKQILNKYRKEPLPKDWYPISIFCEKCNTDETKLLDYNGKYKMTYKCKCNHKDTFDLRKKGIAKLPWRTDWSARQFYEKVDYEPAGKDHFAAGGSVDTAKQISKEIYKAKPPFSFPYEWISIKGGRQFSSSKGDIITLKEMLEIYEPQIIRYLFASTRPNAEFAISFNTDVIKIYQDFDKLERIYFKEQKVSKDKENKLKRIYELSSLKIPKKLPYQPSFRHLTNILQINNLEIKKTTATYEKELSTKEDKEKLKLRAECAKNWLNKYAPEDFKFKIQEPRKLKLTEKQKKIIEHLIKALKQKQWEDKDLHEEFYAIIKGQDLKPNEFFSLIYKILINKEKGPKLASFILSIGQKKVIKILKAV